MNLPEDVGLLSYTFSTIWLIVPLLTFILFDRMQFVVSGLSLSYFQLFYTVITLSISYYFVDKNLYQSKYKSIMSAIHNSLITFTIISIIMYFDMFTHCTIIPSRNIVYFVLIITAFMIQSMMTNKNTESTYNFLVMSILILLRIVCIHWIH